MCSMLPGTHCAMLCIGKLQSLISSMSLLCDDLPVEITMEWFAFVLVNLHSSAYVYLCHEPHVFLKYCEAGSIV